MAEDKDLEPPQDSDAAAFEDAFRRLSEVAASLEEGGLTLAEATQRYEQGMNLVRRCNQLLDEAQLKISNLKDAYSAQDSGMDSLENVIVREPETAEESEAGLNMTYPTNPSFHESDE